MIFIKAPLLSYTLVLFWAFCKPFTLFATPYAIECLKVEYLSQPLGIDVDRPAFSWQMKARESHTGLSQQAYQIEVTDETGQTQWNSGKVESGVSVGIIYEGKTLKATTLYQWTVSVWDQHGNKGTASSSFETGLLSPANWEDAQWIGGTDADLVLSSHYLSVFKMEYTIQLDQYSQSKRASFVFGANDTRLMDKNRNLLGIANQTNQSYIRFELDLSGLHDPHRETAQLHVYRVGYAPTDKANLPLTSYDIPTSVLSAKNQYDPQTFYVECNFGIFNIYLNGHSGDHHLTYDPTPISIPFLAPAGLNLNPYGEGQGGDYISFPMLADIGYMMDKGQKAQLSDVKIRHFREPSNIIFSSYDSPTPIDGGKEGRLVVSNPSRNAMPMLRTQFTTLEKAIQKARLYVTARGVYEIYLNGKRVGNDYFNPGLTQYNKTHLYQTYDVSDQVYAGEENVLGALLGEGWWSGNITYRGEHWNYFGDRQSLLAKLVITYEDGSQSVISSNDREWKYFADGPIRYSSFFQGEIYDATKENAIEGWSLANYDDSSWKPAAKVPLAGTAFTESYVDFLGRTISLSYDNQQLLGQIGETVQIVQTRVAQSVEEVRPGVFVYDLGQNMVGIPHIRLPNGPRGDTIRLRYAEVRYPDLPEYQAHTGMVMMENIRSALTQDIYIRKGGEEIIQPHFTFHGFRYLEITGIAEALPLQDVKGLVLSSVHELSSSYLSSNELVNKLWENITWSMRGNFLSIPTDTPARNERMGWSGDINVFSRASTYLGDVNLFFKRHLRAMRDMQEDNGRFTDVAPVGCGFGGILWGSAGITVAWEAYQQYGDLELLREHYPAMKAYLAYLDTRIDPHTGLLEEGPLGDWLSPENGKNNDTQLWTAYHLYDLDIMAQVANLLGHTNDASNYREQYESRKRFFNDTFVDKQHHQTISSALQTGFLQPTTYDTTFIGKPIDTQASYAIPLAFDLFNEHYKPSAVNHLANTVTRKNTDDDGNLLPEYSLMTGFIGTAVLGQALSENGHNDLAYRLLQQETYPSWLYPVVNGATTIWERLNSYTIENGFGGNNRMNSFNHYAFGAVASWMYNYSLGIQRDPNHVAFKHFLLKPMPDPTGQMTWAKGYYDAMYGRISSEWEVDTDHWTYRASVPANTTATLYLPNCTQRDVRINEKKISRAQGISYQGTQDNQLILNLSSGNYEFIIK